MAVGETRTVLLEGSGGGYRWFADVQGDDDVVKASTDYAEGDVGEGGWRGEVAIVTARRPGSVEVRLAQRRAWETPDAAGGGQMMRVTVRPS